MENPFISRSIRAGIVVCVALALVLACAPAAKAQSEDEVKRMSQAMPAQPTVKPAKPRKLLVFTLCKGYKHSSVPYCAKAFQIMGEKTGAFEATCTDDPAVFAPESLARFDAVCFDNTTGELFEDAALKKSLMDFVKGGKGIVGVHAATDCFYKWPEFGEMMGGYFDGHPWGAGDTVTVKIDEPAHPLNRAFMGEGFDVKDEIYQLRDPYSRENLRVLLSLDVEKTDMTKKGIKRTDGDFAVSWVRSWGKGRVFYCSLGHNHHIFWTPAILQHYLDGIQFALGDLPADTTPSAELPEGYIEKSTAAFEAEQADKYFGQLAAYEYGQSAVALSQLKRLVRRTHTSPAMREALADRFAAIVNSKAPYAAKQFACKQLSCIGTAKHVPTLAKLLTDEELSDMGRYALERIPCGEADAALLAAVAKTKGVTRIGIVNSLGQRRCEAAIPACKELLTSTDPGTVCAAIEALGAIGSTDAAAALREASATLEGDLANRAVDALLRCGDAALAAGDKAGAAEVYQEVHSSDAETRLRGAALVGLARARGSEALPAVKEALAAGDAKLSAAIASAARIIPGSDANKQLALLYPDLDAEAKVLLLHVFADRGDPVALPVVTKAARAGAPAERLAALDVLGTVGDASCVRLLAEATASSNREERNTAEESLTRLSGEDVDATIAATIEGSEAKVRKELVTALAARGAASELEAVFDCARDKDGAVRAAAFRALAELAPPKTLARVVKLLVKEKDEDARRQAERAVADVARKGEGGDAGLAPVLRALKKSWWRTNARVALINALGRIGDNAALPALDKATGSVKTDVRDAAVRALADWQHPKAMESLARIATESADETRRTLALRGLIRLLRVPSRRPMKTTLGFYEQALALSTQPDEIKQALAGLGELGDAGALELVKPYLDDADVATEAKAAAEKIEAAMNE